MRVILVPVADRAECALSLGSSFELAASLGADVVGCHLRPHRKEEIAAGAARDPDGLLAGDSCDWLVGASKRSLDSRSAQALFARMAKQSGFPLVKKHRHAGNPNAIWQEMVGTPARILSVIGPVSDLSVYSRPARKAKGPALAFLMAGLLHSGKPVLVLPQKPLRTIGKNILIAWNQSAEAAAAVSAALPLLQRAQRVTLVRSGSENRLGPKVRHVANYLAHWDVRARVLATKGDDVAREIQKAFRKEKADLLVMGAYSRGRFRELVFGGLTDTVLRKLDVPALLCHR